MRFAPFARFPLCPSLASGAIALLVLLLLAVNAPAAPPPGYYLVWADEFNGTSLDGSKWWAWVGPSRDAVNTPDAVTVGGGYLTLTTYTVNGTHYSAILSSDGLFRPWYGYLEASINFDTTAGMWSGFWLQSPNEGQYLGDTSASGAEIDICEHRKTDANSVNIDSYVQSTVHWDGYGANHKQYNSGNIGSGLGTGFHTYGLLWDTNSYSVLIDGAQLWSTTTAHSDRTELIQLSSEVQNASWAGVVPPGGYGDFLTSTTKMVLDYVRYYAPTSMVFWVGASSGSWSDIANWLQSRTPGSGDEVVFSYLTVANSSISLGQDTAIGGLAIQESGPVSISGRTLTINSGGINLLSAVYDGTINSSVSLGAAQTWRTAGGRTLTINGVISGTGNLTLNGYGTVALPAVNTHSGTITVSNGTLLVSGAAGTNTLTLAGGTLSGNGTILGPVVASAGGTLAPGNAGASIATLAISNTLTLQSRSLLSFDVNESAGTCDKVIGLTSVTFGGTLVLNNQAGTFAPGDAFKLFDARSYVGAFDKITPVTPGANLAWDTSTLTNDGTLRVTSTIATNITAQATLGQVDLSWPTDHTGWRLQAQTNLPRVGLTTNWVTVPGSPGTNHLVTAVDPSAGSVFFRLSAPPFFISQFARGNLLVLQIGNGTINAAGAPGVLNEYSPAGGPCLSQLALPTSGPNAMLFGSIAYGSGLSLSPDGHLLLITGYSVPSGSYSGSSIDGSSTTGSPAVLRAVGLVNAAGTFTVSVTTTQFTGSSLRSAVTDGRGNFWAGGGSGGIVYLGANSPPATLSTVSPATRNLNLVNGRLYYTTGSGQLGIMAFTGAPTSAATPTMFLNTAGTGSGTASPTGFAFNPAMTVAYVADNRSASNGGGIQRYNWNGAAWVYAYTLGYTLTSSKQVWELAADFSGSNPILYATSGESSANSVVCVTDTGPSSAFTTLATAPTGDAFRGIAFAPTP